MDRLVALFVLTCCVGISLADETTDSKKHKDVVTVGDAQYCLNKNPKLIRFEVLPGGGWDNLRNKDAGLLIKRNFSQCKTTADGKYLIPDELNTVAIKSTDSQKSEELIKHWSNYTSTTAKTVNAEAGLQLTHFGIGGKFSDEWRSVRSRQYLDESVTTRIQLRYIYYFANLQPGAALTDEFKSRLLKIAANLQINKTDLAEYESQLLVRDYGTHIITSVDAGAGLVQLDQIRSNFAKKYSFDSHKIVAAAKASFFHIFNIGGGYQQTVTKEFVDSYLKNRTHTGIDTHGGPAYKPYNFSMDDWVNGLDENLVAMDRSGDPLFYLITPSYLPELPLSVVYKLTQSVKDAVDQYYKANTYLGCTNADSPNFSYQANVDDGSCESPYTNYTFGGVFQTCTKSGSYPGDLCAGLDTKNPLTGTHSCPDGYEAVLLETNTKTASKSYHHCHRCWLVAHCCNDGVDVGKATYSTYWCAATSPVKEDSGFMFGGLFSNAAGNPLTNARSCPPYFSPQKMSAELYICVSDDYELGSQYSVPFAGFFSCKAGNPLKLESDSANHQQRSTRSSLSRYLRNAGAEKWPQGCPNGYSQHLAVIENGCDIHYCILSHSLNGRGLPEIKRPPYIRLPSNGFQDEKMYKISENGLNWEELTDESVNYTPKKANQNGSKDVDSAGSSQVGVTVGVLIAVAVGVCLIALIIYVVRKKKQTSNREYKNLGNDVSSQYGTNQHLDMVVES